MRFQGIDPQTLAYVADRVFGNDPAVLSLLTGTSSQKAEPESIPTKYSLPVTGSAFVSEERPSFSEEAIVQKLAPVFRIVQGRIDLSAHEGVSDVWGERVSAVAERLEANLPAIGRIEARLAGNRYVPLGTAWMIEPEVAVTNRHVVDYFAEHGARGLVFKRLFGRAEDMTARLDFADDATGEANAVPVLDVLYLSPRRRPDIALVRLARLAGAPPLALRLMQRPLADKDLLCVVGYPEADDRANPEDVKRMFGDVFGHKRLAPGLLKGADGSLIRHLCNTLGGNSGSPLLHLESGEVAGLHFGGRADDENHAEPIAVVAAIYRSLTQAQGRRIPVTESPAGGSYMPIKITIPITVTVEIGAPVQTGTRVDAPSAIDASPNAPTLKEAVALSRRQLAGRDDIVAIRAGWKFTDGWITDTPAVVVAVDQKLAPDVLAAKGRYPIPSQIGGFPVDIAIASPMDLFPEFFGEEALLERVPARGTYKERPDLPLERQKQALNLRVQPGPDAGSGMLREFLQDIKKSLVVGMYRFSAPHVVDAVIDQLGKQARLKLTLDTRADDIGSGAKQFDLKAEETKRRLQMALAQRFDYQPASTGAGGVFASSYHIKVAVKDDKEFWLSSGSWQSSNQPEVADPKPNTPGLFADHNREMHVVIENADLAKLLRQHLERDFEEAKESREEAAPGLATLLWVPDLTDASLLERAAPPHLFPPFEANRQFDVHPLLTPDNYAKAVLPILKQAKRRIWFQNQSLNIRQEMFPEYRELLETLKGRQAEGLDVRIIVRGEYGRDILEKMKTFGFKTDRRHVRLQDRCHNKMIVVDDNIVLIGSHNWTNDGTLTNRDASLLFRDVELADYCAGVFDYDWQRIAEAGVREQGKAPRRAESGENPPPGMRLISLDSLELD